MTDPLADLMDEVANHSDSSASTSIALAMAAIATRAYLDHGESRRGEHGRVPAPRRAPAQATSSA